MKSVVYNNKVRTKASKDQLPKPSNTGKMGVVITTPTPRDIRRVLSSLELANEPFHGTADIMSLVVRSVGIVLVTRHRVGRF
jgi:hypothetical protein